MKHLPLITFFVFSICTSNVNAQNEEIIYYAKLPQTELSLARTTLAGLIDIVGGMGDPLGISVLDDRIEMTFKGKKRTTITKSILFSDLFGYPIRVTRTPAAAGRVYASARINSFNYVIRLKENYIYAMDYYSEFLVYDGSPAPGFTLADTYYKQSVKATEDNYKKLADYLCYFQHQYSIQRYDSMLNAFKPMAAAYCALSEKPAVKEEQRKFLVQANVFNEQKMYEKAIDFYIKAIETDPTGFPAAYSNLALLSAQVSQFDAAIHYMKRYLLLEPEAAEIRSAQDKIYEWEILMQN